MSWKITTPEPKPQPERPPFNAGDYPLGTVAEQDGVKWYVVWDNQDKRHYWNDENKDI
ncbi:hypothetical protein SEA_JEMERALD_5 [Microbacterium phage Jemerald]|nr:hypothetical protein SEA_JUICER_5 [Microbacterium phage Juicer]WNO27244.1 hypothetical protein SEA_JEMERALD_5 [Microbacterium phage Jemerald]